MMFLLKFNHHPENPQILSDEAEISFDMTFGMNQEIYVLEQIYSLTASSLIKTSITLTSLK